MRTFSKKGLALALACSHAFLPAFAAEKEGNEKVPTDDTYWKNAAKIESLELDHKVRVIGPEIDLDVPTLYFNRLYGTEPENIVERSAISVGFWWPSGYPLNRTEWTPPQVFDGLNRPENRPESGARISATISFYNHKHRINEKINNIYKLYEDGQYWKKIRNSISMSIVQLLILI